VLQLLTIVVRTLLVGAVQVAILTETALRVTVRVAVDNLGLLRWVLLVRMVATVVALAAVRAAVRAAVVPLLLLRVALQEGKAVIFFRVAAVQEEKRVVIAPADREEMQIAQVVMELTQAMTPLAVLILLAAAAVGELMAVLTG
jgi:hypothetical protein